MIRCHRGEREPDFSTDARDRPNIVWIVPIPQRSTRARLQRVVVVYGFPLNPTPASLLAPKTSARPDGLRRNRLTKATHPRRQFANGADATVPRNSSRDKRKFRKQAGRAKPGRAAYKT